MSCQNVSTVRIGAAFVSWGKKHQTCVTPDNTLTGGEYFEISNLTTDYYVWTDINNGSSDPAPAGKTAIEVNVPTSYTVAQWLTAAKTAIEVSTSFWADISTDGLSLLITSKKVGAVLSASADVDTSFAIETAKIGVGGDIGKTEGGIEITQEVSSIDIATDQTGTAPIDSIITGITAGASMSLLEMTKEKWALIVGEVSGSNKTPSGGTQVTGLGTARVYQSLFNLGGELNLHPVEKALNDYSSDVTFLNCAPLPETYNFSSEETSKLSLSFKALIDSKVDTKVNMVVIGDATQDLR